MNRRSARLLLVDDSSSIRRVIRQVLAELGFLQVDEAEDGVEALGRLHAASYDLVISDWYMPRMTGIELLREIRATPALVQVPVLIITGYVTQKHLIEAVQAGANAFVVKPFVGGALEAKVTQLLSPLRPPAEAPAMATPL